MVLLADVIELYLTKHIHNRKTCGGQMDRKGIQLFVLYTL
jgi:hypothetical protein